MPDGALRDIYVVGTTLTDWQQFIDFIHTSTLAFTFAADRTPMALPVQAIDVFRIRSVASPTLTINCAEVTLRCYFFTQDEIELSFDPREVQDESAFSAVVGLMRRLSQLLHKTAILAFENDQAHPILRVELAGPA